MLRHPSWRDARHRNTSPNSVTYHRPNTVPITASIATPQDVRPAEPRLTRVSETGSAARVTLGIDIGTTSVKAVAADEDGNVVARARVPHQVHSRVAGEFEHDVDEAWRDGVVAALAQVGEGLDVAAVNVSAMVPSLGAVDADGRGVGPGPALRRPPGRARRRRSRPSPATAASCSRSSPGTPPTRRRRPGYWPAQAVANHALTGRGAIDSTTAMTAYPLFDFVGWDEALAAEAGHHAGRAARHRERRRAGRARCRTASPAAGALVGGGTIDAMGEQIVAGADAAGDVLVICGATLITWGVVEEWAEVPGLWTIPHTAAGMTMIGGPSNAGGLFVDRVRRWVGDPDPGAVAAVDPERPPDLAARTCAASARRSTAATSAGASTASRSTTAPST